MRLLAYKPFWLDQRYMTLHPYYLPDYTWPVLQVVTSPCPMHKIPVENCVCGMYSVLSHDFAREWRSTEVDLRMARLPILGVVQVLGETVATPCNGGYYLRSWGQFLWGLVKPPKMKSAQENGIINSPNDDWEELNPVWYRSLPEAVAGIQEFISFNVGWYSTAIDLTDILRKGDDHAQNNPIIAST